MGEDYEEKIVGKIDEIHQLQLEALRRAGVAKEKEQGLEIESTEAVRLFREATGYILRLRELREDVEVDLQESQHYDAGRVVGYLEDYNRILDAIRDNPSFENCVKRFENITHSKPSSISQGQSPSVVDIEERRLRVNIGGTSSTIKTVHKYENVNKFGQHISDTPKPHIPMDGTTKVEMFVYPRLIRLTKDVETSLIGRCASGKRPS